MTRFACVCTVIYNCSVMFVEALDCIPETIQSFYTVFKVACTLDTTSYPSDAAGENKEFQNESENERVHLYILLAVMPADKLDRIFRTMLYIVIPLFTLVYFIAYFFSPYFCHRLDG